VTSRPSSLVFVSLSAALIVCWSSGFVGIRFTTETATVAQVLFGRSVLSGLLLLPLVLRRRTAIGFGTVAEQGAYAFLGMFLYLGGFAWAIGEGVPTGLVALMADLVPLAIAVLSAPILGLRLTGRQWAGTAVACAGVLAVSWDALALGHARPFAYALPILGMLAFAISTVIQERRRTDRLGIVERLCLQCLWAAVFFLPFTLPSGGPFPALTSGYLIGMVWLVVLATFGGWLIYYEMLRLYPPATVSAVVYLSPPVTMIWAFLMFGEPLTWAMAGGLAVTLAGVALVTRR
jgi:drug/metabolite transporter (DMT)-like permease